MPSMLECSLVLYLTQKDCSVIVNVQEALKSCAGLKQVNSQKTKKLCLIKIFLFNSYVSLDLKKSIVHINCKEHDATDNS